MKPTIPEGRYVDSNTRGKTESKKVEKISQKSLTQIKGRNPRVQLSCRKVYFYFLWRRAYHMCSHMGVCVRGKGDRQEPQKSRATVYRAILQSGEFLHIQSGCSSYPHHISREGEQWHHVWSQVTNFVGFRKYKSPLGEGPMISLPWFWRPLPTVKSTRKRSQCSVTLLPSLFKNTWLSRSFLPHSSFSEI